MAETGLAYRHTPQTLDLGMSSNGHTPDSLTTAIQSNQIFLEYVINYGRAGDCLALCPCPSTSVRL